MEDKIQKLLSKVTSTTHKIVIDARGKKITRAQKAIVGEAALSLANFSQTRVVMPYEKVLALRALSYGIDILDENLFYYISYHGSWGKIKDGNIYEIQKNLQRTNLDTLAMILKIKASELGY